MYGVLRLIRVYPANFLQQSQESMASDTPAQIISIPDTPNGAANSSAQPDSHVNMQLVHAKPFPDISKIEVFSGVNFKRWQERLFSTLDMHGVADALTHAMPDDKSPEGIKLLQQWTYSNKVCRHTILSTLSNELFDVYCTKKVAKEIWDSMIAKYTAEDTVKQKFVIGNYYKWEMKDDKDIKAQIHEYQTLLEDLKGVQIELPEPFVAGILIEKLPESWKDYKRDLKHKFGPMSLNEVITHIIIEDTNRREGSKAQIMQYTSNANLVETQNKRRYDNNNEDNNKPNYNKPKSNTSFKKEKHCYVCGKPGHFAAQCRKRATMRNNKPPRPSANLSLNDVLHVPEIRTNLVSVSLLGKAGVKVSFESDKIVMTKNNVFVEKGYCNHGLFVLNVSEIMN
ncbi:unnamed protein product [Cuscuta europaea]|uniref:CCHC-type domain-containing protein n=1 Tax=Cuscuta europaea TaxID=41803 RepID=A0A9P0ZIR7_CUSEU|nr:unnamed protein product [Cuscuta europaea]